MNRPTDYEKSVREMLARILATTAGHDENIAMPALAAAIAATVLRKRVTPELLKETDAEVRELVSAALKATHATVIGPVGMIQQCCVCAGNTWHVLQNRDDGMQVWRCAHCGG